MTQQAIQLGFLPAHADLATRPVTRSSDLCAGCELAACGSDAGAVVSFGTSDALAGAYGRVSLLNGDHYVASALVALQWGYHPIVVIPVNGFFFIIDLIFFAANSPNCLRAAGFRLCSRRGCIRHAGPGGAAPGWSKGLAELASAVRRPDRGRPSDAGRDYPVPLCFLHPRPMRAARADAIHPHNQRDARTYCTPHCRHEETPRITTRIGWM